MSRSRLLGKGRKVKAHRTPLSTARHEAAHAVIATKFGVKVLRIRLSTVGAQTLGETEFDARSLRGVGPVEMMLITMAGSVADNLWRTSPVGVVSGDDCQKLMMMGVRRRELPELYRWTRSLVVKHRKAIDKLGRGIAKAHVSGKAATGSPGGRGA